MNKHSRVSVISNRGKLKKKRRVIRLIHIGSWVLNCRWKKKIQQIFAQTIALSQGWQFVEKEKSRNTLSKEFFNFHLYLISIWMLVTIGSQALLLGLFTHRIFILNKFTEDNLHYHRDGNLLKKKKVEILSRKIFLIFICI